MKTLTVCKRSFFYSFLVLILLGSYPSTVAFSAGVETPTISIISPTSTAVIDTKHVVISGTYTDNVPKADLHFTASDKGNKISDSTTNETEWSIDETSTPKTWTFSTSLLEEGTHDVSIKIEETNDATMVATSNVPFTIALTRPYVTGTGIILSDGTVRNGEDLTSVPLDVKIKITVVDDKPMEDLLNKRKPDPFKPVKVLLGSNTVTGTSDIVDNGIKDGKYSYDIIFTPNPSELKLNKTYLVFLDPGIVDDLDNPIFTKFFKFTTKSDSNSDDPDNPHGHYKENSNMCATCHNTHDSKNSPSLIGGSYQVTFNNQLTQGQPVGDPSQNYCMACHDGTTNAPFDKDSNGFHHNNPIDDPASDTEALKQPESCTSCHNPHLEWSEGNQNLLKDHYVYKHTAAHPDKGLENPIVDSLDNSCDSCHENIDFSTISGAKGLYELFAYNKSTTAVGSNTKKFKTPTDTEIPDSTISDYSLCLRCHNLEKKKQNLKIADIETYYLKPSGHNFAIPDNATTQRDGSKLNGPIPCAECHDTHGSSNLYNLRDMLGNNAPLSAADKFSTTGSVWNEDNERTFCLKCHNQGTEINGKMATFKDIPEHQGDSPVCSSCHGGSFIEAAHAPTKLTP